MMEYSLVGIRADKTRMVICEHLTQQQAVKMREDVERQHVFLTFELERQEPSAPQLQLVAD